MLPSMNPQPSSLSSSSRNRSRSSYKYRFVQGFLRALKRINKQQQRKPFVSCDPKEVCKRYLKVKTAADASMASAVGSRRAWSRALIKMLQKKKSAADLVLIRRRRLRRTSSRIFRRSLSMKNNINTSNRSCLEANNKEINSEAKGLRKVVPGGQAMDFCNLLDETAHYIKCLSTQVKLMRRIADFYSA